MIKQKCLRLNQLFRGIKSKVVIKGRALKLAKGMRKVDEGEEVTALLDGGADGSCHTLLHLVALLSHLAANHTSPSYSICSRTTVAHSSLSYLLSHCPLLDLSI